MSACSAKRTEKCTKNADVKILQFMGARLEHIALGLRRQVFKWKLFVYIFSGRTKQTLKSQDTYRLAVLEIT